MKIVAIGVSAGGPETLKKLFSELDEFHFPVLLAQHNLPEQVESFALWLSIATAKDVVVVDGDTEVQKGKIYLPSPYNDLVVKGKSVVGIERTEGPFYPNIDRLFESLAIHVKEDAIAVVLGGLGGDGMKGAEAVMKNGGMIIVQKDAKFPFMPRLVAKKVKKVIEKDLDGIISFLRNLG